MKIYIAIGKTRYEPDVIFGHFATEELAQDSLDSFKEEWADRFEDDCDFFELYDELYVDVVEVIGS